MKERWLLDLFCGAGGCTKGYQMAGFKVRGVDNRPQPRYVGEQFIQADALEYLAELIASGEIQEFDAIHASPPCQGYSRMRHLPWLKDRVYPMLIDQTRELLLQAGLPFVIENVEGAPLQNCIVLCGATFNLKLYRHRVFESSQLLLSPPHSKHGVVIGKGRGINNRMQPNAEGWTSLPGKARKNGLRDNLDGMVAVAGHFAGMDAAKSAMGIEWMTRAELAQAIPPVYTEFIGHQLIRAIEAAEWIAEKEAA